MASQRSAGYIGCSGRRFETTQHRPPTKRSRLTCCSSPPTLHTPPARWRWSLSRGRVRRRRRAGPMISPGRERAKSASQGFSAVLKRISVPRVWSFRRAFDAADNVAGAGPYRTREPERGTQRLKRPAPPPGRVGLLHFWAFEGTADGPDEARWPTRRLPRRRGERRFRESTDALKSRRGPSRR